MKARILFLCLLPISVTQIDTISSNSCFISLNLFERICLTSLLLNLFCLNSFSNLSIILFASSTSLLNASKCLLALLNASLVFYNTSSSANCKSLCGLSVKLLVIIRLKLLILLQFDPTSFCIYACIIALSTVEYVCCRI